MSTTTTHRQLDWTWSCDRILVATDGSAPSLAAVGWAARIAEDVPAELSVVYAYEIENDRPPTESEASAERARAVLQALPGAVRARRRTAGQPAQPTHGTVADVAEFLPDDDLEPPSGEPTVGPEEGAVVAHPDTELSGVELQDELVAERVFEDEQRSGEVMVALSEEDIDDTLEWETDEAEEALARGAARGGGARRGGRAGRRAGSRLGRGDPSSARSRGGGGGGGARGGAGRPGEC